VHSHTADEEGARFKECTLVVHTHCLFGRPQSAGVDILQHELLHLEHSFATRGYFWKDLPFANTETLKHEVQIPALSERTRKLYPASQALPSKINHIFLLAQRHLLTLGTVGSRDGN